MKHLIFVFIACIAAHDAMAARMRDMSLSVEDSMREPDITTTNPQDYLNPGGFGSNTQGTLKAPTKPGGYGSAYSGANNYDATALPADSYMVGYCDPNVGVRAGAMQDCIAQGKKQTCDIFAQLPNDAQRLLDRTISCLSDTAEYEDDYDSARKDCGYERARLGLLKKYWEEQQTAYALVFLPDMVMNAAANCMPNRRGY